MGVRRACSHYGVHAATMIALPDTREYESKAREIQVYMSDWDEPGSKRVCFT